MKLLNIKDKFKIINESRKKRVIIFKKGKIRLATNFCQKFVKESLPKPDSESHEGRDAKHAPLIMSFMVQPEKGRFLLGQATASCSHKLTMRDHHHFDHLKPIRNHWYFKLSFSSKELLPN